MLPPLPYALSWHGEAKAVSVLSESVHPNSSNGDLKKVPRQGSKMFQKKKLFLKEIFMEEN
jgi:hypothetical protein